MCNCNNPHFRGHQNCGRHGIQRRFNCPGQQTVIPHHHHVHTRHDIINEYDVMHQHDVNYFDVVRHHRDVRHNDFTHHQPNYCCDGPTPRWGNQPFAQGGQGMMPSQEPMQGMNQNFGGQFDSFGFAPMALALMGAFR